MVDENRPLFDDEDLPAWMKEGGISYRGKAAVHFSGTAVDFTKPPWEDTRPEDLPRAEYIEVPDWMHEGEAPVEPEDVIPIEPEVPEWMQTAGKPSVTQSGRLLPRSAMLRPINPSEPEAPPPPNPAQSLQFITPEPIPVEPETPAEPIEVIPDVAPPRTEIEPVIEPPREPLPREEIIPAPADLDWLNAPTQGAASGDFEQELQFDNQFDSLATSGESVPDWLSSSPPPQEVSMPESVNTGSDDDFRALFDESNDLFGGAEVPSLPPAEASEPIAPVADELSLDWLDRLPEPPAAAPVPSPQNADDLPDWMRDVPAIQTSPTNDADDLISSLSGDMPDWMRAAAPTDAGTSSATDLSGLDFLNDAPDVSAEPGEIPDWLAAAKDSFTPDQPAEFPATGIQPGKFQPKKPGKRDSSEIAFDIDAIMNLPLTSGEARDDAPVSPKPHDITPYEAAQLAASENMLSNSLSDSLSDVSFDDTTIDEAMGPPSDEFKFDQTALEEEQAPTPAETPGKPSLLNRGSNVRRLPAMETPPPSPVPQEPVPLPAPELMEAELPDFVEDMRPDGAPVELNISGVQVDVAESPVTSLSDSLRQLRERSRAVGKAKVDDTPAEGALAEIPGVIAASSVQMSVETTPKQMTAGTVLISNLDQRRIRTLQSLLEVEDEAEKAVQKARRRSRSLRLDRMVVAVLLFAIISVPFFTDVANIMIPPSTVQTPEQTSVIAAMDALPAKQHILVAFEYGPGGSGELDDLARVLLRDIFKKGAMPVIVSTNAAGALHAESLLAVFGISDVELAGLNRVGKPLLARQDYLVLRYLPAGAAGVRALQNSIYSPTAFEREAQFGTDIEGKPSLLGVAEVQDLQRAPVIVLAETPEEVRIWAEQYRPPGVQKIMFAASVAADATARTYSASRPAGYIGPLVGLRDATIYRKLRQGNVGSPAELQLLDQRWQSTGLGALTAGIFILFGALFAMIGAIRQRSKPKGETNR